MCAKENLARQLNKALGDADMWRQKYEIDGVAKAEELEMASANFCLFIINFISRQR